MTWFFVILLAALAFVGMAFVLKAPRGTREAVAAALLLGIAGYAAQGSPSQPAAPKEGAESVSGNSAALVEARLKVTDKGIPPNNKWVVIADGLARNGRYADAAEVLRGAIAHNPKNSDAWLAMANALMAHSEGMLTPASLYAYRQAAKAEPANPGPPFFLGLAFLQGGRVAEARALWGELVARAPADAPWRAPLAKQIEQLDAVIAAQASGQTATEPSRP